MRSLLPFTLIMPILILGFLWGEAMPATAGHATPAIVNQLHLTDVEIHGKKHHGRHVEGRLPGGTWVEIDLDNGDGVEEVESHDSAGFPASAVESVVPAAVRDNASYPADGFFRKIELHDGNRVEIEGYRTDGKEFEAEFSASGRLIKMKSNN